MKRAQAALEFLMSYGWALLVVIGAFGTLAYLGILSPPKDVVTTCVFPPGMFCEDTSIHGDRMYLYVRNGAEDIRLQSLEVDGCVALLSGVLDSGNGKQITLSGCEFGNAGNQFLGKIYLNYSTVSGGLPKQSIGEIHGLIQG